MNHFKLLNISHISCLVLEKIEHTIKVSFVLFMLLSMVFITACGGGSETVLEIEPPAITEPDPIVEGTNLSQLAFLTVHNPDLNNDIYLNINNNLITGRVGSNAGVDGLVATFTHDGAEINVNDVIQENSSTANDFTNIVTYTVKTSAGSQESYQVDLTKFTGLPIVYLSTNNGASIESKEDYVAGSVLLDGGRHVDSMPQAAMKIRGRGNSTWYTHPKKPFQMKFDNKTSFLDMPADKKWLFLAEYSDKTMLRNRIAFEMGYISQLDWTPQSAFAEVYLNEEYNGTYNITQKVEVSNNRLALGDAGYLLEIDQLDRLDADDVYFYTGNFLINIKEPELDLGSTEYNYVKNLLNEFETVLHSAQFTDPASGYAKYIDIYSFIDWFLISEITKNVDSKFYSSIYLNVIPGEKIKMGPLWDFDLSFGNVDYADSQYATGFWVKDHPWYTRLFQDPEFVDKINERFAYFRNNQNYILDKIDQQANALKWAQQENDNRWQTIGVYVWPNPVVFSTYGEEVAHLKSWYIKRMNWLESAFNNLK
ncbi:CotH kinase family protein [Colwelliaceae bacterium 6471]